MRKDNYILLDIVAPVAFVGYALYVIGRAIILEGVDRLKNRWKGKNLELKLI